MTEEGLVQSITGNVNWVIPDLEHHHLRYPCQSAGKLLQEDTGETTLLCVGDRVRYSYDPEQGNGAVQEVLPRETVLLRRSSGESERGDPMVANADLLVIVLAPRPELNPALVDRYLLGAVSGGMEVQIVVNKIDLEGAREKLKQIENIYRPLDYPVLATSATEGTNLMRLHRKVQGNFAVMAGYSGVGKSTLINRLYGRDIETGELQKSEKGRHTTTYSAIYRVGNRTWITDTPGIRAFGLYGVHPMELDHYFPEFHDYLGHCKFSDCTHRKEPGCAIKEAVEAGDIATSRYRSYREFFEELNELLPDWEQRK